MCVVELVTLVIPDLCSANRISHFIFGAQLEHSTASLITQTLLSPPQIAREHGIRFFETSAKANINIEKAFLTLAEDILRKVSAIRQQHLKDLVIRE